LNDLNTELINSYKQIKKDPEIIISQLSRYKNNSPSYYKERELIPTDKTKLASRFLYLNRTGFNGIYRVNRQGVYNVPYGNKKYKCLFDYENIRNVSKALNQASLTSKDFYKTLAEIDENDLVFIDPPYTVSHENNGFVKYNQKIFIWKDQERLLKFIKRIEQKKAFFIMTNAAHPSIKKLFKPIGTPKKIERCSVIGGTKAFRGIVHEYLYTNIK
jgi:DNA adenine methylase